MGRMRREKLPEEEEEDLGVAAPGLVYTCFTPQQPEQQEGKAGFKTFLNLPGTTVKSTGLWGSLCLKNNFLVITNPTHPPKKVK